VKKVGIILDGRLAKIRDLCLFNEGNNTLIGFGLFPEFLLASEALIYEYIKREI